jgi:polyisoprenoid-binding protein YceI
VDFELTSTEDDPRSNFRINFQGKATINRKDWSLSWNAVVEGGGVFVNEKVALELEVSAIRQS